MSEDMDFFSLEETFWTGGLDVYEAGLSEDAVMLFPGTGGILRRLEIIDAVSSGSRWSSIAITDPRLVHEGGETAVLAYLATARRDFDGLVYQALATSVYRRESGAWKLLLHQQTPL